MRNQFLFKALAILLLATLGVSCSDNDDTRSSSARLTVRLTDAPGDYDAVYVDVQDVMINATNNPETGWVSLEGVNSGVYNLLELTGGINVLLADNQLPAGELRQIRLVLGDANTVEIDGESLHLDTPSALQSGLKIQVNETLEAGYTYDIILDFDVDASVVEAGSSGIYNLKPVIRGSAIATSGIITGTVSPADFQVVVSVDVEGEKISAYADENGVFMLYGVPAGTYDLTVTPDPASWYGETQVMGVEVVNGETTTLAEEIVLEQVEGVGIISGSVTNEGLVFTATTEVEGESVEAVYGENGIFNFYNLPVGTYDVTITPAEGAEVSAKVIEAQEVKEKEVTDLGAITLE